MQFRGSGVLYEIPGSLNLPGGLQHKIFSREAIKYMNSKVQNFDTDNKNESKKSNTMLK